jgi:hypothetical protein
LMIAERTSGPPTIAFVFPRRRLRTWREEGRVIG